MAGKGSLHLLDGNSLVHRAFHALPTDLATASGTVTNAVFGFTSMLVNLIRDYSPSAMAVAFDRPEPTFRYEIVPDYKGNRQETPELLRPQFDLVRAVLDAMGIRRVEAAGYEADDVLATLATEGRDLGMEVVVVSGDRDTFQLVEDPLVKVLYTRRGISDTVLYDEAGIVDRCGVGPGSYPVLAALRGDTSDNLAGVPGIGEKTAARLVGSYGDLDGLFAHLRDLTPKLRESLEAAEDQVRRNALVIPLVRDVALDVNVEDLELGAWNEAEIRRVFGQLELRTPLERLAPLLGDGAASGRDELATSAFPPPSLEHLDIERPGDTVEATEALRTFCDSGDTTALFPLWSGDPGRTPLAGMALAQGFEDDSIEKTRVVWLGGDLLSDEEVMRGVAQLPRVVTHGAKELMRRMLESGFELRRLELDTAVVAYLLDPSSGSYRLEDVTDKYLGISLGAQSSGDEGRLALVDDTSEDPALGASRRAVVLGLLVGRLYEALGAAGLSRLHDEVELPLIGVLARMEVAGIRVDAGELRAIAADLTVKCRALESEIHQLAGEPFNVNSTPQLRTVLFDRLGLTPGKKTKTGYSTDAQTLEKLRGTHPIVDALLGYREVEKLRSTYGEPLLAEVGPDGRIHATFHQTVARTGRLSSDRPNLHNIPVRTAVGMQLRNAFIPADGCRFLVADYDQIELRVIAHLSGDPGLVAAFAEGRDIHRTTAARVFGVAMEDVTPAQRNRSKMVSYGLAYGMEAFGLAQRLGIATEEAREILDAYFDAFPAVRAYMDRSVSEARGRGYTETLFGRRRPLPDLTSPNRGLRMAAERQAMNAGIQGLAADLFKVALVKLESAMEEGGLHARLVLQVHDEVLVETPSEEEGAVGSLVPRVMSSVGDAVGLTVPLRVSAAWGSSWADAKK